MLKIKDNVDLKELEKFGFKIHKKAHYKLQRKNYIKNTPNCVIFIENDTRWITSDYVEGFFRQDEIIYQDLLYDLIKADLVEKVEE